MASGQGVITQTPEIEEGTPGSLTPPTAGVTFQEFMSKPHFGKTVFNSQLSTMELFVLAVFGENTVLAEGAYGRILEALNTLSPREEFVIRTRFGIQNPPKDPKTLKEIGKCFHVSVERIRQIQNRALRKLSRPMMKDFIAGRGELIYWEVYNGNNTPTITTR